MRYALEHAVYLRDRLTKTVKLQVMKVRERGWILSAYSMPPDGQEISSLRIVVRLI